MDYLKCIPVLLVLCIIFLVITNVKRRKSTKEIQQAEDEFWDRERRANETRKKDISELPYIKIPVELLPEAVDTEARASLLALSEQNILNLTGQSNTDLKLAYGVSNLETLSECDERFTTLVNLLDVYSKELLDAGQEDTATKLLEFAVSIQADAKPIYIRLAKLYSQGGTSHKISELIASAEELNTLSKDSIITGLKAIG